LNYPALLRVTKAAIEKLDCAFRESSDRQTITVKAVSSDGETHPLFSINTNLFGRVQDRRNSSKPEHTFEAGTFVYAPKDDSFATYLEDLKTGRVDGIGCERSFSSNEKVPMVKEVQGFTAELLSGFVCARSTCQFACEYFDRFPEMLILSMDVDNEGKWKLLLQQKKGAPNPEDAALFQERMKTVSQKTLASHITCPITGKLLKEPVRIQGKGGGCYESEALKEWASRRSLEPLPVHKSQFDKLLKRAQKLTSKLEEGGQEFTPALQEECRRLESSVQSSLFLTGWDIPANLSGRERGLWIAEFAQKHQLLNQPREPLFINTEEAEQAEICPATRSITRLFRATHTFC
jgi:hypothetical protein